MYIYIAICKARHCLFNNLLKLSEFNTDKSKLCKKIIRFVLTFVKLMVNSQTKLTQLILVKKKNLTFLLAIKIF